MAGNKARGRFQKASWDGKGELLWLIDSPNEFTNMIALQLAVTRNVLALLRRGGEGC